VPAGDYFVIQVFKDPYYGTPLFYTNGGASSCLKEANTAARSRATIRSVYIGPKDLAPDQSALFEVTVSRALQPRSRSRPCTRSLTGGSSVNAVLTSSDDTHL